MKKIFILLCSLVCTVAYTQDKNPKSNWKSFVKDKYVNYTELGLLFGKSYQISYSGNYSQPVEASTKFMLQTYNGLKVYKNLSVGATVGVDWFSNYQIVPISLGVRVSSGDSKSKKVKTFAGIDAGYGFMWLNEKVSANQQINGGLSLNPMVGFLIPTGGNANFIFSVAYKHNNFNTKTQSGINEYPYSNETTYNLNRMAVRLGVNF
jgi:hypothetical protein